MGEKGKEMLDKTEIKYRFRRCVDSYEANAPVQKQMVERLFCLLTDYMPVVPGSILEIGCGTGLLSRFLKERFSPAAFTVNDLVEEMCRKTVKECGMDAGSQLAGDIEEIPLERNFDLIISSATFQWFVHPALTLKKLAAHINSGGWLAFSTFGPENFRELRTLTDKGLFYPSTSLLEKWLGEKFDIVYREEALHTLWFPEPLEILRHIKKTGVNGGIGTEVWTKGKMNRFCQDYFRFRTDKGFPLTYHPLYWICRKKK